MGILTKGLLGLLVPVSFYSLLLFGLSFESVQRHALYVHAVNWPLWAAYHDPVKYGFQSGSWDSTLLSTPDGALIGVTYMRSQSSAANRPVILYFHGNAGNRLTWKRRLFAKQMLSLGYDHVAVDYRSFGDSSNNLPPSEHGLNMDARTVWDWLISKKDLKPEQIVLAGHSLGTGVASQLAYQLSLEESTPKALILIAPYASIASLLETYKLFKFIPILAPIRKISYMHQLLLTFRKTKFDTRSIIKEVQCPILLIHAKDDWDINASHSYSLFADLTKDSLVETRLLETNGTARRSRSKNGHVITYLEMEKGGHNRVMHSDIAAQAIKEVVE